MRILLAQINPTIGDISGNAKKILNCIEHGKKLQAQLLLFPEMALTGYPPEDFLLLPHFINDIEQALQKIIASTSGIAAIIGVVRRNPSLAEKPIHNSAAIIENGQLIGFQDKSLLPTYDVFDERRFFEPAQESHLWKVCGQNIAITICEDLWQHSDLLRDVNYYRDPILELSLKHPDIALNLSASPFSITNWINRLSTCSRAAETLQAPLLLCNQVGGNDSLIFDGHSLYVDKDGTLLDYAKGFEEDLLLVDLSQKKTAKKLTYDPIEELYDALVLGVRDYFKKSGFAKACLGLSGGIDSALVACIASEALGENNIAALLMPSRYSSPESIKDAAELAQALNIKTYKISIEELFQGYVSLLAPHFTGMKEDATEENIQARIRGMILMAFSNKLGYIVLSTGNKSELAMGYSTLYGDMCGGLAVLSDVTKQQVYALAEWINKKKSLIPLNTIKKSPSAELRPNQKDTDSLPEYSVVDNVLQAYVEDHQSPKAIAERFGYSLDLVSDLVKRIHQNEYKRRQSPPGLRISNKAFSVGRRFPIVQKYV